MLRHHFKMFSSKLRGIFPFVLSSRNALGVIEEQHHSLVFAQLFLILASIST